MAKRMFAASVERSSGSSALRWLLLMPTAVAGSLAAYLAVSLAWNAAVYAASGAAAWSASPGSFAASFAMAYAFVATGVKIAPAQRAAVAQALIGIGAAVAAIALYDNAVASEGFLLLGPEGSDSPTSSFGFITGLMAVALRLRRSR